MDAAAVGFTGSALTLVLPSASSALDGPLFCVRVVLEQPQLEDCPERAQGNDCDKWNKVSGQHADVRSSG